jgi:hypothetical protein
MVLSCGTAKINYKYHQPAFVLFCFAETFFHETQFAEAQDSFPFAEDYFAENPCLADGQIVNI